VLPALNRLRSSKDFAIVTKTGYRATTPSLVIYLKKIDALQSGPQIGLIVSKVVGGSVARHRIARQVRHAVRERFNIIPTDSQVVIRVTHKSSDYSKEIHQGISKVLSKIGAKS